jgi:Alpha/beta hydrolase domain
MELSDSVPPELVLDARGLAKGGVRTPWVDVPIARTSGLSKEDSGMAILFGAGELFDAPTLRHLYPVGAAEYLSHFEVSLNAAIGRGFVLAEDRHEILELAAETYPRDQ